jgi:type IV secretory pathway TrbD component
MPDPQSRGPSNVLIGNILLGAAAVMLLFFVRLWETMGVFALLLWMAVAALGVYFIVTDKGSKPPGPPN